MLVALAVQGDAAVVEALKGYKHPWEDFGNGSSVTAKETIMRPDIDKSGKLVYRPVANEITSTVMAAAGEKTTLKIEGAGQESYIPYYLAQPSWARGRGELKGTESIAIGSAKHECQVYQIALDLNKDAGQVTVICKSPTVPYWAVRWRTETLAQGRPNTSEEELVLEVDAKVKVGDRDVSCVLVQSTVEAGATKTVKKEWRSEEVPGRVAKREVRQYREGKEVESSFSQMDVVRFKGKR